VKLRWRARGGWLVLGLAPGLLLGAVGQQQGQPPVRVNILNVCTPGEGESREMRAALEMIPLKPRLAADFEVARGRSTLPNSVVSRWVRLRQEFPADSPFSNAQYSLSAESGTVTETLVVRVREPKNVVLVSIEDKVTSGGPGAVVASDTPADRVNVERFGKSSLVLTRCPQANQSAYETLFERASALMRSYRAALGVRRIVPGELERLQPGTRGSAPQSSSSATR
jgi:hypothetical protein